jgi:hypothetical protein
MTLVNIVGDVGSGKTLLSVYLASKSKKPVYANFNIKIKSYNELLPETLAELNCPKTGAFVIIDEAYSWLESRTSQKEINRYLSYILFQSRKKGMDIITTDQLLGTIDVRFRLMENYEIHCENVTNGFYYRMYKISRYKKPRVLKFLITYDIAQKYYPLYDSWQPINPIDNNLMLSVSSNKTKYVNDIEKIKDEMLSHKPANQWSKDSIKYYLMKNNHPSKYIDLLYGAIKMEVSK